ncbi:MAG TPA: type II secretion system protein [Sumerlaeia bacterium]|nr:type II secretion system protein [Sumerlaeia bacterium]
MERRPTVLGQSAFTLLEVLVAILIFSIVTAALFNTFRISTHAFERGEQSSEALQSLRFTIDQITRDMRSVYYETDYNVKLLLLDTELYRQEEQLLRDLQDGNEKTIGGIPTGLSEDFDPKGPDSLGRTLDVQFVGGSEEGDAGLAFTHSVLTGAGSDAFMGLERVRYFLLGRDLYRQRSNPAAFMRLRPNLAEEIINAREARETNGLDANERNRRRVVNARLGLPPPGTEDPHRVKYFEKVPEEPLPAELLAQNVVAFDTEFGFYSGQWQEADSWDSESKQRRTPEFHIDPTDPNYHQRALQWQTRATDGLPSFVKVRLTIEHGSDKKKEKRKREKRRTQTIETTVWIPAALESYMPGEDAYFEPQPVEQ